MKEKINNYVSYILKVNNIDNDEMYNEITSNLHDRFDEYKDKGLTSDDAYLKTVNTLGDFNFNNQTLKDKHNYKPNWANISLMISLALAVLSTIVLLINSTMSIFFTGLSISLYVGSAYYLYRLSQYVLKEEKDVLKHNEYLKEMFTNLKTNFIFWNINISFWITSAVVSLFTIITGITSSDNFFEIIVFLGLIFIIIFSVLLLSFNLVYKNLEKKYLNLTNQEKLDSYIRLNISKKEVIKKALITIYLIVYNIMMILTGMLIEIRRYVMGTTRVTNEVFIGADSYISFLVIANILFIIISLFFKKINTIHKLLISIVVDIISMLFIYMGTLNYLKYFQYHSYQVSPVRIVFFSVSILFVFVIIVYKIINNRKNKLKANNT